MRDESSVDVDAVRRDAELAQELEQLAAAAAEIDDAAPALQSLAIDRLAFAHLRLGAIAILERRVLHWAAREV